jgi:hypothetical protein
MKTDIILTIIWTVASGAFILWGYYEILYRRMYVQSDKISGSKTNSWLFAGIIQNMAFSIMWCLFALAAALSFIGIFVYVICIRGLEDDIGDIIIAHNMFLLFSSLYSFLLFRVFKLAVNNHPHTISKLAVIADLACVAAAAVCMAVFIFQKYTDPLLITAAILLAFHCTVVDCFFWGITWYRHPLDNVHHTNNPTLIFSAAINTDPSATGILSHLHINHTDVEDRPSYQHPSLVLHWRPSSHIII